MMVESEGRVARSRTRRAGRKEMVPRSEMRRECWSFVYG